MMQEKLPILHIDTERTGPCTGDLFGIFFEDLNHAADGGLYAELVQNRSFEFDPIDNPSYTSLTAWEKIGGNTVHVSVEDSSGLNPQNTHYAVVSNTVSGVFGIKNLGYNTGIPITANETYLFSCFARNGTSREGPPNGREIHVSLESQDGTVYARAKINIQGEAWTQYETRLTAAATDYAGVLAIRSEEAGTFYLDMVSLFPEHTYKNRRNGLRRDIAELLAEMKPKFMRFPGGCLVHDGTLNPHDRDSMYRWKNTIGPVECRPARRNSWRYNQTLGLGFYEYFLFCEDIGAKPLPVLPAGYDPHHKRAEPVETLGPWIDDALDLIEFANGDAGITWGAKRAALGHPAPFNLEYIAIGNEEVGDAFFERYVYFHNAIRQKYPAIKIINSASPFAAGSEFEKGWESARNYKSDLIDEHYYQSPEWFIANNHRYDSYKADDPKVFLGEYASWGNTWYNALVEASYMTGLERNAHAVGLACYAPLLCNVDYVNWKPDLIWFNNHQVYGTANYYVQKLFMHHRGTHLLPVRFAEEAGSLPETKSIDGEIRLAGNYGDVRYSGITLTDTISGSKTAFEPLVISGRDRTLLLCSVDSADYTLRMKAVVISDNSASGGQGFQIHFGYQDEQNYLYWEIGGWQNQDAVIGSRINGRSSCLTQSLFTVQTGQEYDLCVHIRRREIACYIDGHLICRAEDAIPRPERLYYSAGFDGQTGDVILKCVNMRDTPLDIHIDVPGIKKQAAMVRVYQMAGFEKDAGNSFDDPVKVGHKEFELPLEAVSRYTLPKESLTIFRL
ncbi:alpha-N-arabinofuranosidase [Spirochaetia bacterium]|nr:alpha-N-arabinofuranosidase [Spirochaetia bacterium]